MEMGDQGDGSHHIMGSVPNTPKKPRLQKQDEFYTAGSKQRAGSKLHSQNNQSNTRKWTAAKTATGHSLSSDFNHASASIRTPSPQPRPQNRQVLSEPVREVIRVLQAYQDGSALPEGNYTADCEKVTFPLSPDQFLELSNCLWGSDEDGRNHGPQAAPEASSPGFQELGRYIQDKVPWTYDYCCSLFVISSMSESVIHSVLTDKLPELILNHARRTVEGLPDGHPHKDQYKYKLAQLKVRNNTEARNPVDFYLAAQGEEGQDKDGDDQIQDLSGTYSLTSNTMKWWRPIPDSYLTFVSDKDISYPYPPQIFEIFWSHETLEQHLLEYIRLGKGFVTSVIYVNVNKKAFEQQGPYPTRVSVYRPQETGSDSWDAKLSETLDIPCRSSSGSGRILKLCLQDFHAELPANIPVTIPIADIVKELDDAASIHKAEKDREARQKKAQQLQPVAKWLQGKRCSPNQMQDGV